MNLEKIEDFEFCISARQKNVVPEFLEKYQKVSIIPSVARFGHSVWDGGEVLGNEDSKALSNALLAIAAHQKKITRLSEQTSHNQRDDADLIVCATLNECTYLVSNDKKFMLLEDVKRLSMQYGVTILSSQEFILMLNNEIHDTKDRS